MAGKVVLEEAVVHETEGEIVLRGIVRPSTVRNIQRPDYQREILSDSKIDALMEGHRAGRVPDIDVNMRGTRFTPTNDGSVELLDDIFVVDGLQRMTAAVRLMASSPSFTPVLGAYVTIGKDEEWERERFKILNNDRTKLSPNVHLRNERKILPVINRLYRLTETNGFPLYHRVQWGQTRRKNDALTATVFVKTVGRLHSHLGAARGSNVFDVARALDEIGSRIGLGTLRDNAKAFYDLVEECWGMSGEDRSAVVFKGSFLAALATVLSDHPAFWDEDGYELMFPGSMATKLKGFRVKDKTIEQYAGSGTASVSVLYELLLKRLNSSRRIPLEAWE